MIFAEGATAADALHLDPARAAIRAAYRADERASLEALIPLARLEPERADKSAALARRLVVAVRQGRRAGGLDAFLHEYDLTSQEGVVLMCLAEALLRIPDADTADRLIRDKIGPADWERHLGHSRSLFVNASTWGLMLTGRVVRLEPEQLADVGDLVGRLVARSGEPIIRQALVQAMRIMGRQFVMGRTIDEALKRAAPAEAQGYRHSYDMLGEAACTRADAERYFEAYLNAIATIAAAAGASAGNNDDLWVRPGISVKLSALHPRFEFSQRRRLMAELAPRLLELARRARAAQIGLTVDSEEANRLDVTLDVFEAVYDDDGLGDWEGLGLAVQTYQKRGIHVVDWLEGLARRRGRRIPLRLVKGAYWDSEIKLAQEQGLDGYPVFTRKAATDVCFLACARKIAAAGEAFYPQFATHNAHALAAVVALMGERRDYEFQRLHGMGEVLYAELVGADKLGLACRVYAPVGSHEDLLAYLVRRLLENGANTSFVNRIVDEALPIDEIIADPVETIAAAGLTPHPRIPLPERLYGAERRNAAGLDLSDPLTLAPLAEAMAAAADGTWEAWPVVAGEALEGSERPLVDPADNRRVVGRVAEAGAQAIEAALGSAAAAAAGWDATPAAERAACLERAAELIEEDMAYLMAFCVREAGKSVGDALAEVREAVDFCRYYAQRARADFAAPEALPGPTGERNEVALHGRGVFACISPWNFPLAIFCGQVTAALAAGNAVIAKPAEQTPLIAAQAVARLHRAGVPPEVLHLLPGDGEIGAALVADPRLAGVAFTGSTETARLINQSLAARSGAIVPLIAETGGQNAMIVDSSALPEQVVADVLRSAFSSAGQRCSTLRVLFLQDEVASPIIEMLTGAMAELVVGDPGLLDTDVGPVIDAAALQTLEAHARRMADEGTLLFEVTLPAGVEHGTFFAPRAFEIESLDQLEREVFGPILHVIRYPAERLDEVCEAINRTGYGLTLGVHSRIDDTARHIRARVRAGNAYLNRNMIGAVVGVQPFGGEGLSGTGPKAGGPRYLYRFATERTLSVDTTAAGGNATLLSLGEEVS